MNDDEKPTPREKPPMYDALVGMARRKNEIEGKAMKKYGVIDTLWGTSSGWAIVDNYQQFRTIALFDIQYFVKPQVVEICQQLNDKFEGMED